jgi:hypothetical protein
LKDNQKTNPDEWKFVRVNLFLFIAV